MLGKTFQENIPDYLSAIQSYDSLLQKTPGTKREQEVLFNLYYCYKKIGDEENAARILERLKQKYPKGALTGKLVNPDGTNVSSPTDLRRALLRRPDQFVQTVTEKLMTFALGRSLRYQDMPMVRAIVRQAGNEGDTFEAIIRGVVKSPAFREREIPAAAVSTQQAALTVGPQGPAGARIPGGR